MKVAILTGGGDAPGLNGIIEAASKTLLKAGHEVLGIQDGFEGIFAGRSKPVTWADVQGLHSLAGTYLGTSNKSGVLGHEQEFIAEYRKLGVDGMIVAGGDGTFAALSKLGSEVKIIGAPKTIDNDLSGTDITFGYDTACSVVAEAVDALCATAGAHRRIMIVEAMGRTAGWIALGGGLASYADIVLLPERPFSRDGLIAHIHAKHSEGQRGLMIVVSEGAHAVGEDPHVAFRVEGSPQAERFGGIAERLARWIEKETAWECRHVVLGHLQRARHPTTTDRFLTLAMGTEVARMAMEGAWGQAAVYRKGIVTRAPLTDLQGPARTIPADHRWIKLAEAVGIYLG